MKAAPTKTIRIALVVAVVVACMGTVKMSGQSPPAANAQVTPKPSVADPALGQQLTDLQSKAARLQSAVAQNASPAAAAKMPSMGSSAPAGPTGGAGMGPGGMGKDKMEKSKMGKMGGAPMGGADGAPMGGGMGMDQEMSGMGSMMGMDKMEMAGMMGNMPGQAGMEPSALPGFPDASHLYHIGATDFFLDHSSHITLTTDQQVALSKMREQTAMAKSAAGRQIAQAEQELWTLTASDKPDLAKIEAKVREIEKLSGDARLAFIRAVGDAAKVLTDDQRKILTGFAPPQPAMTPAAAAPMAPAASPAMSPMSDDM